MGIHEPQSLFNEIIIGSNRASWRKQHPFSQDCAEGTFDDIAFGGFYASLKETKTSLTRIDSNNLTYPLRIIIRYEIEKVSSNGSLEIADLPKVQNEKYQEYLGVSPKSDLEGVPQDVHWPGGNFGYFPSYALGYMYAAQLFYAMKQELSVDEILASENYSDTRRWLTQHICQYGASCKPDQSIYDTTGEELNPSCLIDYMKAIYLDVYRVQQVKQVRGSG